MLDQFKSSIPEKYAGYYLFILMAGTLVFHTLVILEIIPFQIVWGGRLSTKEEMYVFETVSITLLLIMGWVVAVRIRWITGNLPEKLMRIVFGLLAFLFFLNTIGNLMAVHFLETILFTPLTFIAFLACLRLAL